MNLAIFLHPWNSHCMACMLVLYSRLYIYSYNKEKLQNPPSGKSNIVIVSILSSLRDLLKLNLVERPCFYGWDISVVIYSFLWRVAQKRHFRAIIPVTIGIRFTYVTDNRNIFQRFFRLVFVSFFFLFVFCPVAGRHCDIVTDTGRIATSVSFIVLLRVLS